MSCANEHVDFKLEPVVDLLTDKLDLRKHQYVSNGFLQELTIGNHDYYFPANDLHEGLDFIDGTAADSVIAPWIKKISKILQRLKCLILVAPLNFSYQRTLRI